MTITNKNALLGKEQRTTDKPPIQFTASATKAQTSQDTASIGCLEVQSETEAIAHCAHCDSDLYEGDEVLWDAASGLYFCDEYHFTAHYLALGNVRRITLGNGQEVLGRG